MDVFKVILIVQLFYAVAITFLVYSMPVDSLQYVTGFSDITGDISLEGVASDVQDSVHAQTEIPVVELGALVFYSGNILIDLLLNFTFAIPQMLMMVVNGVAMLFSIDSNLLNTLQLFISVLVVIMYSIGLIQLITGVRSGRLIA